jgi:serine/threonine protein kinase
MDPALAAAVPAPNNFHDGLGERRRVADRSGSGETVELLCLRRQLTSIPSFEFALRERAGRLASFRHTYFARVRSIDRLNDASATLAVVSDVTRGVRLSQLLTPADKRPVTIDINAALHLIRQFVSAVAMLHENAPDVAHGAIGPERLIVTANARVVIAEYVLGAALEQLHYTPERYWKELQVALPPSVAAPRFDQRTDVTQIGVVALSLVLGRLLTEDETPDTLANVLASAWAISNRGGLEPLPHGLRVWIGRALQIDPRHSYQSALDARVELDKVLDGEDEGDYADYLPPASAAAYSPVPAPAPAEKPADVWEPYVSSTKPSVAPEPAPTFTPDPAPVSYVSEPTPVSYVPEPKPVSFAPEPKSSAFTPEPKSSAFVADLKPVSPASEPRPMFLSPEPKSAKPATETAPLGKPVSDPKGAVSATCELKRESPISDFSLPIVKPEPKLQPAVPIAPSVQPLDTHGRDSYARDSFARHDDEEMSSAFAEPAPARPWGKIGAGIAALILLLAAGAYGARSYFLTPPKLVPTTGVLTMASNPPGAQVFVDNVEHGQTPLTLTLAAGSHIVELRGTGEPRTIPITITAGTQTQQYIELPTTGAGTPGSLQIRTEPAGAQVLIDGQPRGKSPVLVENLAPGEHLVTVDSDLGNVKHTVTVQPGTTSALVVPLSGGENSAPVSGWVSLNGPAEVQLFEKGKLLGTTKSDRIMVSAGRHEIEAVNEGLGYRASTIVQVSPGKVAQLRLEWPKGSISLNALPWAEVWIDGEKSGETPLGNLSLPIGPHEIIFRHPDFGELRQAVTVTLTAPARVSVDLRKK